MNSAKLVELLFSSTDVKDLLRNLSGEGISYVSEWIKLNSEWKQAIENVLSKQKDPIVKEQLEEIFLEIKNALKKQINEKNINLLSDIKTQIEEKLEKYEFDPDSRECLASNFQCAILGVVQRTDPDFANDLRLAEQIYRERIYNANQDKQIGQNKERILRLEYEVRIIEQVLNETKQTMKSPIAMKPACPHICDSEKLVKRDSELREIDDKYKSGSNVIFLYGRPGMGKTTLAKCYAKLVCDEQDVYYVTYENSIEYTVGKLAEEKIPDKGKKVLAYFRSAQERRPVLLIIDNFNEDILQGKDRRKVEEELKDSFYAELVNCGIHVLFTTRIKRERDFIEVPPLPNPMDLFEKYYGRAIEKESRKKVERLIHSIQQNTLMIILTASLLKDADTPDLIDDVLQKLQDGNMQGETTELECYADIQDTDALTLYAQISALLDMSGIENQKDAKRVFANTVLLPLEGMERSLFISIMEDAQTGNTLRRLINGNWVLTDSQKIYLHPLVREIAVRRQMVSYENCETYCQNVGKRIRKDNKFEERIFYKNYAQAIFNMFKYDTVLKPELVDLIYYLSDIYDELDERELSMELIQVVEEHVDVFEEDPLKMAEVLSGIAYSLNNMYESMGSLERAEGLLKDAQQKIDNMPAETRNNFKFIRTKGMILNNFGSNGLAKRKCCQKEAEESLKTALAWHKKALEFREEQYGRLTPSENAKDLRAAIANSYTAIATDYFYLNQFHEAIAWHKKALELRKSLGDNKGMTINVQRIVGCILAMYKCNLKIEPEYISQALDYFPQLLQLNYAHQNTKALLKNMGYFKELGNIVDNDRRLEKFITILQEKREQINGWKEGDEKLRAIIAENHND